MTPFDIGVLIVVSAMALSLVIVIASACRLALVKARKEAIIEVENGTSARAARPLYRGLASKRPSDN